jgi:tripartite-type tricarboxylate transporter receptor subunit TctC
MSATTRRSFIALACATGLAPAAFAQEGGDFFKGRTINIVVGIEQGTGFDLYGRALARHIGRHIPGNPSVIVQNMPGASGLVAFNWLANVAPKDGTVIGIASFSVPFEPLFGNESARFKGPQFGWVGNMDSGVSACLVRADSGISKWSDITEREVTMGAAGRAGAISQAPRALRELGGAKIKLVEGYVGTASIKLAIERNELQGICGISMSTVRSQWSDLLKSGLTKIVLQIGPKNDPELKGVPNAIDFARNDEERQIYNLIFGPQGLGRSFAAPPGVPAERLKTLRDAFSATMKDDAFLADASKSKLDISPQSGEEVQAFVEALYASPPDIIARAKKVLGR